MLRCPECRSRRTTYASMQAHLRASGHQLCHCGGYHYPHRAGSPYCEANPMAPALAASRAGEPDEVVNDIMVSIAWHVAGKQLKQWPYG